MIEEKPGYTDFEMPTTQLKVITAKHKFDPCDSQARQITIHKVFLWSPHKYVGTHATTSQ